MVAPCAPKTPTIDRSACPSVRGHGTKHHRYNNGCTCPDGLDDSRRKWYGLRYGDPIPEPLVDATGTARRLQAAAVHGASLTLLAARIGVAPQHLSLIRRGGRSRILAEVADQVARVVDDLHDGPPLQDPPGASACDRARAWARRFGYVALDEWLDIDDPADLPDRHYARTTTAALVATADLVELAEHHRIDGRPDHDAIGRRVGMSADAVQRRLERRAGGATRLSADQVYAIRDEYLRTRGDGWSGKATAKRYGVSTFVVSTIIHGTTRPELGLTDLTVQQGGRNQGSAA